MEAGPHLHCQDQVICMFHEPEDHVADLCKLVGSANAVRVIWEAARDVIRASHTGALRVLRLPAFAMPP